MSQLVIKFPLRLRRGMSGLWIEDAGGLTLADANPLLAFQFAAEMDHLMMEMANAINAKHIEFEDDKDRRL